MIKKILYIFVILSPVLIGYSIFSNLYNNINNETVKQLETRQTLNLNQAAQGIENFFRLNYFSLSLASRNKDIINLTNGYKEQIQAIFNNSDHLISAITRIDENGNIVYTYPYFKNVIGQNVLLQKHNQELFQHKKPVISDLIVTVQGIKAVILGYPIFDSSKRFRGCLSFLIPHHKITEEFLQELFKSGSGYPLVISQTGTVIYSTSKELVGKNINTIFTKPQLKLLINKMINKGKGVYHYSLKDSNNTEIKKIVVFRHIDVFNKFWSVAIVVNKDKVIKLNEGFKNNFLLITIFTSLIYLLIIIFFYYHKNRLEIEKLKYHIIADKTGQILYEYDPVEKKFKVEGPAEEITGYSKQELIKIKNSNLVNLVHEEDLSNYKKTHETNKVGEVFDIEYRFQKKDGNYIYLRNRGTYFKTTLKPKVIIIGAIQDINEKKLYELKLENQKEELEQIVTEKTKELILANNLLADELRKKQQTEKELIYAKAIAEKSEKLKSEFLAQMSHEIRTPINAILSFTSLIESELKEKLTNDLQEAFEIIGRSGKRITRTIDLILDMSQIQTNSYEPSFKIINLKKIIENSIREYSVFAHKKNLLLNFYIKTDIHTSYADEYTIIQIVNNFVDNAIKYTPSGEINISMYNDQNNFTTIDFSDTGIGISEEYLPKLFVPFSQEEQGYTRKFEGNGLGLALVKNYCELNNIDISVKSRKNSGTTFTIKFTKS